MKLSHIAQNTKLLLEKVHAIKKQNNKNDYR